MAASDKAVRRGMQLLAGFYGTYALVGIGYPYVTGESIFHSAAKRMGWIDEATYEKEDCNSND